MMRRASAPRPVLVSIVATIAALVILATPRVAHGDHGVCIQDADLVVPTASPLWVSIHVGPRNPGSFLINGDVYDTYTADAAGNILFTIPAGTLERYRLTSVHFAFTAEKHCERPTMTFSLRPPDTSTAGAPSEPASDGLLLTIALTAFLLSLTIVSRRQRATRGVSADPSGDIPER